MIVDLLLEKGVISREQLEEALKLQSIKNQRIGQILLDLGYIDEDTLLETLSEQMCIPFQKGIEEEVDPQLMTKVPLPFIRKYEMVPFKMENGCCHVAIRDPLNLVPLDDLRFLMGTPVKPVICRREELEKIVNRYFDLQEAHADEMVDELERNGEDEDFSLVTGSYQEDRDLLDMANEAPIIKFINVTISQAIKQRASDIHIEPMEKEMRVRFRVDGVLYNESSPPKSQHAAIVSRIKIMANMNIAERRLPQDGRVKIRLGGREIDLRVSVIPSSYGERVVLRILEKGSFMYDLAELGISDGNMKIMDQLLRASHGIFLVTGPTGSGKTTTLYAALSKLNSTELNIITVEDPIEYQIEGIAQIQVKPQIGLTFAAGLRHILRQDPDVILVGEIRDLETAEMAIQASLTGHLVFSTLHTNDSSGAITRLLNMGIEPFLVSSSVMGIEAQRLVRLICPNCMEEYEPDPEELLKVGIHPDQVPDGKLCRGRGCDECFGRGYQGRTGIYEFLPISDTIQRLILENVDSNVIKREAIREGMNTLRQDGILKALSRRTTLEEVLRVTSTGYYREEYKELEPKAAPTESKIKEIPDQSE